MRKKSKAIRTPEEVRADFQRKGLSISAWAKERGVSRATVHAVLSGRLAGRIGQSHRVAVLLGIKDGEIVT